MKTLTILKTTMLAALAAAPLVAMTSQSTFAQRVVTATCPQGYILSGNSCVRPALTPTCPSGFGFSAGQCIKNSQGRATTTKPASSGPWAFITREAFGVKEAAELDGANFCAVSGSPSVAAATDFFKEKGLTATHVKVDTQRAGVKTYQKYDCDILVVADRIARSTADSLEPAGGHLVLPEKLISLNAASPEPVAAPDVPVAKAAPVKPVVAPVAPAPLPRKPPATVKKKPAPKKVAKKPVRRKPRCSRVRYAYTSGNTCACAGPRVFTGNACVRPRWW